MSQEPNRQRTAARGRGRFLLALAVLAGLLALGFTVPAQADTMSGNSDVPVAANDTFGPVYADVVDFNALANDHDPQGRPLSIIGYTQPQGDFYSYTPTLTLVNGVFHLSGGSINISFQYTVSNGVQAATASVTIVYKQVNYPVTTVTKKIKPKKIKKAHKAKKACKTKAHKKACKVKASKKLKKAETGNIRFTNTNDAPISITYWNYNHYNKKWHTQIPAGGSVVVAMKHSPRGGDYLIYDAYLLDGTHPPFLYTSQSVADILY